MCALMLQMFFKKAFIDIVKSSLEITHENTNL